MFTIEIAGLLVEIDNRHEEIERRCKDYIVYSEQMPDIYVSLSHKNWIDILDMWKNENAETPNAQELGLMEYYTMHRNIYPQLPQHDVAWLHACAVEVDGEGYAFTAPSGYGKTTQARLWLDYFGSRARIINGDNPLIRFVNGVCYICGSPFGGSEGYQYNTQVPLKGICFLNHSEKNEITCIEPGMAFAQIMRDYQNYRLLNLGNLESMMKLWERIVEVVPVWQLHCNQSMEAVKVAYQGMQGVLDTSAIAD